MAGAHPPGHTQVTRPPQILTSTLTVLGWADEALDFIPIALPFGR